MSKRKLSNRQKERIQAAQEKHRTHAAPHNSVSGEPIDIAQLGPELSTGEYRQYELQRRDAVIHRLAAAIDLTLDSKSWGPAPLRSRRGRPVAATDQEGTQANLIGRNGAAPRPPRPRQNHASGGPPEESEAGRRTRALRRSRAGGHHRERTRPGSKEVKR